MRENKWIEADSHKFYVPISYQFEKSLPAIVALLVDKKDPVEDTSLHRAVDDISINYLNTAIQPVKPKVIFPYQTPL